MSNAKRIAAALVLAGFVAVPLAGAASAATPTKGATESFSWRSATEAHRMK